MELGEAEDTARDETEERDRHEHEPLARHRPILELRVARVLIASVNSTYTHIVTAVFSSTIAAKAWFATAAGVLALVQILTAARIFGKLKGVLPGSFFGIAISSVHRWSGRLAFLCTLPVAFHCIFILGFQSTDARVLAHSIFGSFLYGVVAVKV